jgi:hypothetical protein
MNVLFLDRKTNGKNPIVRFISLDNFLRTHLLQLHNFEHAIVLQSCANRGSGVLAVIVKIHLIVQIKQMKREEKPRDLKAL